MKFNKAILAGHLVISFDNAINGFLTVVMAPVFFSSSNDPIIQLLFSYAAYAAMFIMAPLGSLTFGKIGDKNGRRTPLLVSILGIGVPVFIIGIIPSYNTIGIYAPIALITLRMAQGFFEGAEYSGVLIHNYESGNKKINLSSDMISCGCIGGCIAALICWIVTQNQMPNWFWRIPYLIGGISSFIIFFKRKKIQETDDFIKIKNTNKLAKISYLELLKNYKFRFFTCVLITGAYMSIGYSSMIFGNKLIQQAGYTVSKSMLFSLADLAWLSASISISGRIANKIGIKKQIKYALLIAVIVSVPLFALISNELTIFKIYIYMFLMTFISSLIASCSAVYIIRLFPIHFRYSAFSMIDSIGSIIGGITPLIMLLLFSLFNNNFGCVLWIFAITIPAFIFVSHINKKVDLDKD